MILREGRATLQLVAIILAAVAFCSPAYGDDKGEHDLLDWLQDLTEKKPVSESANVPSVEATLLTLESRESEMFPKISPDGKHLLVVSGKHNKHAVTRRLVENGDPLNTVTSDLRALQSIKWNGSGHATFLSDRGGDLGVWQTSATAKSTVRRLHRLTGEFVEAIVLDDGGLIGVRLLPTSGRNSIKKQTLHAFDFNNWKVAGNEMRLFHISDKGVESSLTAGVNPSLSPDGKSIVFSMHTGRSWHLFMVDVDGSNLIQLTNSKSIDVQPTWSPSGEWIAFTSNRGESGAKVRKENWDIWMIRRDGQHLTRLTYDDARDGAPAIGSNGRVYFHSDRKVDRATRKQHHVASGTSGFHIWSVPLPARVE